MKIDKRTKWPISFMIKSKKKSLMTGDDKYDIQETQDFIHWTRFLKLLKVRFAIQQC